MGGKRAQELSLLNSSKVNEDKNTSTVECLHVSVTSSHKRPPILSKIPKAVFQSKHFLPFGSVIQTEFSQCLTNLCSKPVVY